MKKLALASLLLMAACSPNVETRGALKDPDWQEHVKPGVTQETVLQALGSPSAKSTFGEPTWYYITTRKESYAFLKPEVAEREVTRITFETDGTVKAVDVMKGEDARNIAVSSRVTPTEGHEMTFMEQILGNLGRFNSPAGRTPGAGASSGRGRP